MSEMACDGASSLSAAIVPDALLQGRHERMMQEMTDKALENIK